MLAGAARLVSSGYNGAVGVHSVVGGHPNRPADGQEEDPMAITECHQVCQPTYRNAAPNAEYFATDARTRSQCTCVQMLQFGAVLVTERMPSSRHERALTRSY